MFNIGFNIASLMGLVDIALGICYLVLSLNASARTGISGQRRSFLVIQAILAPLVLVPVGLIFVFQGWRLDPILQFGLWWLHVFIIFLGIKDVVLAQP